MDLQVTFLGRVSNRWRVRVDFPAGLRVRGLTVGLWGEDDRPISPAVVAPSDVEDSFVAELSGPRELPPGTQVRAVADVEGGMLVEGSVGVHLRVGLHAYLHGDLHLDLSPLPTGAAVTTAERKQLAAAYPWMCACRRDQAGKPETEADLFDVLREEFDVDVDEMDDELVRMLRSR